MFGTEFLGIVNLISSLFRSDGAGDVAAVSPSPRRFAAASAAATAAVIPATPASAKKYASLGDDDEDDSSLFGQRKRTSGECAQRGIDIT